MNINCLIALIYIHLFEYDNEVGVCMAYAPLYKQLFRENVTRNYIAIVDKLL